ncbi:iron uptake system component EfeO [Nocardia tenerifensis]|uniref:Iron uptake system component EfeO n=2 Tax=Nocardia tenerifensis TaxID=228006 RepID=A0A318K9X2_9NOCA|nr:iron uptake system protein EfeO [Nocardia tenerifensis]PXX71361.1 iron uptake system component EfeO [Nocardia tenerifensis]
MPLAVAATVPALLVSCTSKSDTAAAGEIAVTADDSSCTVAKDSAETGTVTFRIANNGTKVTEFYVYGTGERVIGEIENIGPGLTRQLIVSVPDPGKYQTACKPGMVGDGIRHDFTVTGQAQKRDESGKLAEAAAGYKRYLLSQATALQETTKTFVAAIKAGDIESAKKQYPLTRTYYERIEPVAESFPDDLDPRLDLREADVAAGDKWTGFHRLEKDLWARGLQPDTSAMADQLLADVNELVTGVNAADYAVDPVQVAGGAQTLLDEVARTKITGEEDTFSHTDLWDFQANVDGSQAAIASLRPIIDERNPELGAQIDRRFAELDGELAKYRLGDGHVSYDTVSGDQRSALARHIDALSAVVSQVQGVVAGA